jgi:hypothetical protein
MANIIEIAKWRVYCSFISEILSQINSKVMRLATTKNTNSSASTIEKQETVAFFRNTVQIQILIHIWSLTPINTHAHPTPMINSERLIRLDIEIYKVDHQDHLTVDGLPLKE